MPRLTIRIDDGLLEKAKVKAKAAGIDIENNTEVVVYALEQLVHDEPVNPDKPFVNPSDSQTMNPEGGALSISCSSEVKEQSSEPHPEQQLTPDSSDAGDHLKHGSLTAKQKAQLLLLEARERIKTSAKAERLQLEIESRKERARIRQSQSLHSSRRAQIDIPHDHIFFWAEDN